MYVCSALCVQVSSLFLPPPANKKPLLHSAIYTKYVLSSAYHCGGPHVAEAKHTTVVPMWLWLKRSLPLWSVFGCSCRYIQNLQRGARHTSSLQTSDQLPPEHRATLPQQQIQISDWLSPDAIPQDMTVSEALLTLRDHLLQDSLKLGQHLKPFQ